MATWGTARGDLRKILADTDQHHLVKDKTILPNAPDGQRRTFYTFDDRLIASGVQSVCAVPLRLFYDGVEMAASGIRVTDPIRGEFTVMKPPMATVRVTAEYYYHAHLDDELDTYLQQAADQVSAATIDQTAPGLRLPALYFAASLANMSQATRWQQRKSEQFLLHDEPARSEMESRVEFHRSEAERLMKSALELRKAYYDGRLGLGLQPAYGLLSRTPFPWTPRR